MKKVMFMFAAAAMFTACGNTQKPAGAVEEQQVEEVVVVDTLLNAADTAAVLAELGVAEAAEADATALQVKLDSVLAAKFNAFEEAKKASEKEAEEIEVEAVAEV